MLRHIGYIPDTDPSIEYTTVQLSRIAEVSSDQIREMTRHNLRELARESHANLDRGIHLIRVSSQIIPFAAHPERTIPWWDEFAVELARIGQFFRRTGLRIEMNPGRYSLLNSPSPETVALSILELGWHVRLLDAMQLDSTHKLVLRVGATFGDRVTALDRFVTVVNGLPVDWKRRLVVENNNENFGIAEVLEAASRTGLPAILALLGSPLSVREAEDQANLYVRGFETWQDSDGVPIVHLGTPFHDHQNDSRVTISFEPVELSSLLGLLPHGRPFDCYLEASPGNHSLIDLLKVQSNQPSTIYCSRVDRDATDS